MKTGFATAAIEIANSIEAHLTGAVATVSQGIQGIYDAGRAIFAGGVPHREMNSAGQIILASGAGVSIFHIFDFLSFKAKAFRFCLFFYRIAAKGNATGVKAGGNARSPIEWGMTMQERQVRRMTMQERQVRRMTMLQNQMRWVAMSSVRYSKQIFN